MRRNVWFEDLLDGIVLYCVDKFFVDRVLQIVAITSFDAQPVTNPGHNKRSGTPLESNAPSCSYAKLGQIIFPLSACPDSRPIPVSSAAFPTDIQRSCKPHAHRSFHRGRVAVRSSLGCSRVH